MEPWFQMVVTIVCAVVASSGFWAYIQKKDVYKRQGADRSYDQFTNPYVIFSPKFENVINTNYLESKKTLKTVTLVAGEGEGADRRITTVACASGAGTGLNRRELYTDARLSLIHI